MGLKDLSLVTGSTISVTGGTPLVFSDDGVTITNGLHLVVPEDPDYSIRRQMTLKVKSPTIDVKTGTYSKDKKSVSFVIPFVSPQGRVIFNTIRIEREFHPTSTPADAAYLLEIGAQICTDVAFGKFWATGSLN